MPARGRILRQLEHPSQKRRTRTRREEQVFSAMCVATAYLPSVAFAR